MSPHHIPRLLFGLCTCLATCSLAAAAETWPDHPANTWVKRSPLPGARVPDLKYEGSGAFDPGSRQWIHFGGHDGIPQGFHLFTCDLQSGAWRQLFANTSPPGVCCIDGANTFDVARGRFVAFPGASLGHGYQWSRGEKLKESHVWLWDPQSGDWTNMRPPPYRRPEKYSRDIIGHLNAASTYDANHEVSFSFGGQGAGGPTNALWVYDAYANDLQRLRPPESPAERDGMGLCYDTRNDCLLMFGSQYSSDERTWIYRLDANRWESLQLDPHPPARKEGTYSTNPKLAFDSVNGVCLCIVRRGEESGVASGTLETWVLDVAALKWKQMEPAQSPDPGASRARNLSYWPEANVFVLASVAAGKEGMQIWTYRYQPTPSQSQSLPPKELVMTAEPTKIHLRWQAAAGNKATRFNVYRAEASHVWQAQFKKIGTTEQTSFDDQPPPEGTIACYRVTALDGDEESAPSRMARTQPQVMSSPVASVLEPSRIEVAWDAHSASDVVGYNLYRGVAAVDTVRKGEPAAWKDNDPEYAAPMVVAVRDITGITKLNAMPLTTTSFVDTDVNLTQPEASCEYKYAVRAYIVRAVNALGVESGPSPYALTLPSEPQHVLLREDQGTAEIKWQSSREKGVVGYHVYKLGQSHWHIERITKEPVTEPHFLHKAGKDTTRYWIVAIDRLGQEGQPSSPVWYNHSYRGFYQGDWHQ